MAVSHPDQLRRMRRVHGVALGALWLLIVAKLVVHCSPHGVKTAESLVPHFLTWTMVGVIGVFGQASRIWRRSLGWQHVVLVGVATVASLDVILFYFVAICALGLTVDGMRSHVLGIPLIVVSSLLMVAVPVGLVALVVGYLSGVKPE